MPYKIRKSNGTWKIIRKSDGKVVGTSSNLKNAQGSIAHRMDAEKKWCVCYLIMQNQSGSKAIIKARFDAKALRSRLLDIERYMQGISPKCSRWASLRRERDDVMKQLQRHG